MVLTVWHSVTCPIQVGYQKNKRDYMSSKERWNWRPSECVSFNDANGLYIIGLQKLEDRKSCCPVLWLIALLTAGILRYVLIHLVFRESCNCDGKERGIRSFAWLWQSLFSVLNFRQNCFPFLPWWNGARSWKAVGYLIVNSTEKDCGNPGCYSKGEDRDAFWY